MKNRSKLAIAALVITSVILSGCVAPTEVPGKIKIGIVAPLTGKASTTGDDMWNCAQLAAEEINKAGGVFVKEKNAKLQIELIPGDTESTVDGGVKAVTKLITEDKVDILVGGFSSAITLADQKIAIEHNVPFVITGASAPQVTRRTDLDTSYMFHHCPTTDDYPEETLLFVNEVIKPAIDKKFGFPKDRKLRLAVLYQDSGYGRGVKAGIEKAIEKHNLPIEIVASEAFKMGETDFRAPLTVIKAAKPDVVYPAGFLNEQAPIVIQGRKDVGLDTIYLSVECNDDPDYYKAVGKWGEYSIQESRFSPYTTPAGTIKDSVTKFKSNYRAKYGKEPSMMGASTYEGVYIAAKAIEIAGSLDKTKIREALTTLEVPQMVEAMQGGKIKFSPDYRETKFQLYMEQLFWNETLGECRPKIVWPDNLKEADFVLPEWYKPGSP
ncbi:MAG: ABC transporter substrate-binding protein [Candidatus Hydrothermarchaeota archaeon]